MIAILSPYGRNEVTAAAIRLADLAAGLGYEVRFVACGVHERSVHPLWDGRVRSCRRGGLFKAASGAAHVVHFQCHKSWYENATLVNANGRPRHILVPNWHGIKDQIAVIPRYDQIVCPTKTCAEVIRQEIFSGDRVSRDELTWTRWDPGIPPIRREGTVADGRIRACFFCDAAAIDFCGPLVLQLAQDLLGSHRKLDVTLLAVKSWAKQDRVILKKLLNDNQGRIRAARASSISSMNQEFHAHDWVVVPAVRGDFGLAPARALACGAAVICHDVEPFSEQVTGSTGLLVPCEIRSGPTKAPVAVPHLAKWLDVCDRAFSDTKLLFNLQTKDWQLAERQQQFNQAWTKLWNV